MGTVRYQKGHSAASPNYFDIFPPACAVVVGFVYASEGAKSNKAKNIRKPNTPKLCYQLTNPAISVKKQVSLGILHAGRLKLSILPEL